MKHSLIVGLIVITGLLISGCINFDGASEDMLSKDEFVAVLEEYDNCSFLIGNTTYPPVRPYPIPMPVFPFPFKNNEIMQSQGYMEGFGKNISVNDSLKILHCKRLWTDTPTMIGSGYGSLTGVYSLPYTIENVFTIQKITRNGTISATYGNQTINLKPGEKWTGILSSENATGAYYTNMGNNSTWFIDGVTTLLPWPVRNEISVTITNEGIFNKSVLSEI